MKNKRMLKVLKKELRAHHPDPILQRRQFLNEQVKRRIVKQHKQQLQRKHFPTSGLIDGNFSSEQNRSIEEQIKLNAITDRNSSILSVNRSQLSTYDPSFTRSSEVDSSSRRFKDYTDRKLSSGFSGKSDGDVFTFYRAKRGSMRNSLDMMGALPAADGYSGRFASRKMSSDELSILGKQDFRGRKGSLTSRLVEKMNRKRTSVGKENAEMSTIREFKEQQRDRKKESEPHNPTSISRVEDRRVEEVPTAAPVATEVVIQRRIVARVRRRKVMFDRLTWP